MILKTLHTKNTIAVIAQDPYNRGAWVTVLHYSHNAPPTRLDNGRYIPFFHDETREEMFQRAERTAMELIGVEVQK